MTVPITQEQLDAEVIFSMLVDASNLLHREWLPGTDTADAWLAWRGDVIWAYLPSARHALPLSTLRYTAPQSEGATCRIEFRAATVKKLAVDFLEHLLHEAQRKWGTRLEGRRRGRAVHGSARRTAALWTWVEF